jgi:hypothetical protein
MNSPFVIEQAKAFADRVQSGKADDAARVDLAIRMAYGRNATQAERDNVLAYLDSVQKKGQSRGYAWSSFCQTLLASAEFRYMP